MEIELLPGEEICPKCKGKGETYNDHTPWGVKWKPCNKCWGDGKLDWIQMAMGKHFEQELSCCSCSSSSCSYSTSTKREGANNDTKWLHSRRFRNISYNIRQLYVRQKREMGKQFY